MNLKKCFCCELRKGVIILGWIGITFFVCCFIMAFSILIHHKEITRNNPEFKKEFIPLTIATILFSFVSLLSYIFLLSGATKKNHREILPWLIINKITIISMIFIVIYVSGNFIGYENISSIIFSTIGVLIISSSIIVWLAVLNLYKTLQKEGKFDQNSDQILII